MDQGANVWLAYFTRCSSSLCRGDVPHEFLDDADPQPGGCEIIMEEKFILFWIVPQKVFSGETEYLQSVASGISSFVEFSTS